MNKYLFQALLPISLLSRHLLRLYLIQFFCIVGLLLLLFMLVTLLRLHDLIIQFGANPLILFNLIILSIPKLLTIILPLSALFASTRVISRLNQYNELIIIRQIGLSNGKLLYPLIFICTMIAIVGWLNSLFFIPLATQEFNKIKRNLNHQNSNISLVPKTFHYIGNNTTFYAEDINASGEYQNIIILQTTNIDKIAILAKKGIFNKNLMQPGFILFKGSIQKFEKDNRTFNVINFDSYQISIPYEEIHQISYRLSINERFISDLLFPNTEDMIDRQRYHELVSKGHDKIILPLYSLIVPLIAALMMMSIPYDRHHHNMYGTIPCLIICFTILAVHRMMINIIAIDSSMLWLGYSWCVLSILVLVYLFNTNKPVYFDFFRSLYNCHSARQKK